MDRSAHSSGRAATAPRAGLRIPAINGLRGLAIIAVVSFHVVSGAWSPHTLPPLWGSVWLINGWTGVNLFFILSGFVLFLPLAADPAVMATPAQKLRFYRHRARRLLPLFFVAVFVEWSVARLYDGMSLAALLKVLEFRFIFNPSDFFPPFNGPLWSIGDELAFSAFFPLLVVAASRFNIVRLTVLVAIGALGFRLLGAYRMPDATGTTFNTDMFLCRIDEFVLGMLAADLYVRQCLPRKPGRWLLAGAGLVVLAWCGYDLTTVRVLPAMLRAVLNDVLDAGFFAILLVALLSQGKFAKLLSWRPLQVVGMMCYSIYIWHWPLRFWLMPQGASLSGGRFALALIEYLTVTLAISALTYRFIEFSGKGTWRSLFLLGPKSDLVPLRAR